MGSAHTSCLRRQARFVMNESDTLSGRHGGPDLAGPVGVEVLVGARNEAHGDGLPHARDDGPPSRREAFGCNGYGVLGAFGPVIGEQHGCLAAVGPTRMPAVSRPIPASGR